jgi:hypothetical protein
MKDEYLNHMTGPNAPFFDHACETVLCRAFRLDVNGLMKVIDGMVMDGVQGLKFAICHVFNCTRSVSPSKV